MSTLVPNSAMELTIARATRPFGPTTPDRIRFEKFAIRSFVMARTGASDAVRLGVRNRGHQNEKIFVELNTDVTNSGIAKRSFPGGSDFKKYRMYMHVGETSRSLIPQDVGEDYMSSHAHFRDHEGGNTIGYCSANIWLHVCSGGVFLLFDSCIKPYPVETLRMGDSLGRINPMIYRSPPVMSIWRRRVEYTVNECFDDLITTDLKVIKLGRGGKDGRKVFAQFEIYRAVDTIVSEDDSGFISRVRVYMDIVTSDIDLFDEGVLDVDLETDEEFKAGGKGVIVNVRTIELYCHVCPVGVVLLYDCAVEPKRAHTKWVGNTRTRTNICRCHLH